MSASTADTPVGDTEALERMYRITSDRERSFDEKLDALLSLGREYLGVEAAFLTDISEGTQKIVAAKGDHELLQPGRSCPLSKAYCKRTVELEDALTVQHAAVEGWEGDAAYHEFGLESYLGTRVVLDGEIYGTVCFADRSPRSAPFTDAEETFAELLSEWVSHELFRRQAREEIESQRDRLEEIVSIVSHDLRNPLGVAEGWLDIAEETGDREAFDRCRTALERMDDLIDDLLELARQGESITDAEPVAVADVARDAWSFVETGQATLTVETDAVVDGDASRLQQAFENLFANAVEHAGETVTVRVGVDEENGVLWVEDDGPGIPAEKRGDVLEEGYSTDPDGTGFGLSIVRRIAEAHGWTVDVTEGTDGGARFEFHGVAVASGE